MLLGAGCCLLVGYWSLSFHLVGCWLLVAKLVAAYWSRVLHQDAGLHSRVVEGENVRALLLYLKRQT